MASLAIFHSVLGVRPGSLELADLFQAEVHAAEGSIETSLYPGSGHSFTDSSLPDEYDSAAAELARSRVSVFLR